ncbi:hypothetical protein C0993_004537, partial [Termitomyces sp. T159_Od127]
FPRLCFYHWDSPSPCASYPFDPWDSLVHWRSLVPSSCTPGTCANPRHSSSTLPGTRPTHWHYQHSPTHRSCRFGLLRLAPSWCSASVYTV